MPSSTAESVNLTFRSKQRGLPGLGEKFGQHPQDGFDSQLTPYRLPSINNQPETKSTELHSLWSKREFNRQQGNNFQIRPSHMVLPPRTVKQYYQLGVYNPVIHIAAIAPADANQPRMMAHDDDPVFKKPHKSPYGPYEHASNRISVGDYEAPSPTRSHSPREIRGKSGKSTHNSVHWSLGLKNQSEVFDSQGATSKQGPFSREFQRKCLTPGNWLRMKYSNRSKTLWW